MKLDKRYAITGASIIDGNGGEILHDKAIVINGKKIERICDASDLNGTDIQKVDMKVCTLCPDSLTRTFI